MASRNFNLDMEIPRGDSYPLPMRFYTEDEETEVQTGIDISNWNFYYTAKRTDGDNDSMARIALGPEDVVLSESGTTPGVTDHAEFLLPPAGSGAMAPGEYFHGVQAVPQTGRNWTIGMGVLTITPAPLHDLPPWSAPPRGE